jgi:hypothetical protein
MGGNDGNQHHPVAAGQYLLYDGIIGLYVG